MDMPIAVGELVAGKYRVERVLGDGGMGIVVSAVHVKLGERRAIKVMRPAIAASPEAVRRFLREAQAAARLKSEHVAKVYDVDDGGPLPFMIMEYLEGADLGAVLDASGPLPVPEATLYVLQACEALGEAHAAGLVHRDVKPQNLFLTRRADGSPCVKVLDFGIAKALAPDDGKRSAMTAQGLVLGTAHYMSPEQINGDVDIDARTDVWALGVTLYELVTGKLPFDAGSMMKLFGLVTEATPAPPSACAGTVPAALDAVILRCLEKERSARPANAVELSELLLPFAPPAGQRALLTRDLAATRARVGAATEPAAQGPTAEQPPVDSPPREPTPAEAPARPAEPSSPEVTDRAFPDAGSAPATGSRSRLVAAGAVVAFVAGLGGTVTLLQRGDRPPPEPTPVTSTAPALPAPPTSSPPPRVEPAASLPTPPTVAPSAEEPPKPGAKPTAKPAVGAPGKPATSPSASPSSPRPATPSRTEVNIP